MERTFHYLDLKAKELKDGLTHFMLIHSAIAPRLDEEVFAPSPEGTRYYQDLDIVGAKMQAYLSECYAQFCSMISPLLEGQPDDVASKMHKSRVLITRTIEHKLTFCDTSRQALELALAALEGQVEIVKSIYREKHSGS